LSVLALAEKKPIFTSIKLYRERQYKEILKAKQEARFVTDNFCGPFFDASKHFILLILSPDGISTILLFLKQKTY